MQRKLKSVFRRSSKSKSASAHHEPLEGSKDHSKISPLRGEQRRVSSDKRGGNSIDSSATGSVYTGRSRPVSSIYDDPQNRAPTGHTLGNDSRFSSGFNGGATASAYKAHLPALSPVNDVNGDHAGVNGETHEEDVADRNIARYGSSDGEGHRDDFAVDPPSYQQRPDRKPVGVVTNESGAIDNHSRAEPTLTKRSSIPPGTSQVESGLVRGEPRRSDNARDVSGSQPVNHHVRIEQSGMRHATIDGTAYGVETALARKLRESGVADLRNTIDTDGDITWAPAVTHEVIKPHQHEIVQHKIYREIHNYEHFHRIQPVRMTEVLPPRHWIPNPDGEGLIEINADELPARTGENRWWSICEHSSPYSLQTAMPKYRTEPEIIEAGTFITKEGFERKETIIIHPPTLADLTGYGGPVQAMHFDHKTGKSWMGELTTIDKLQQLQKELDQAPDGQAFKMHGFAEALPSVPSTSVRRSSASIPARKPVNGPAIVTA